MTATPKPAWRNTTAMHRSKATRMLLHSKTIAPGTDTAPDHMLEDGTAHPLQMTDMFGRDPRLYPSESKAATHPHCPAAPASTGVVYENAIHLILPWDEVDRHRWRLVPRTAIGIGTVRVRQQPKTACLSRFRTMRAVTTGTRDEGLLVRKVEVII
jgi:hypothetical protein